MHESSSLIRHILRTKQVKFSINSKQFWEPKLRLFLSCWPVTQCESYIFNWTWAWFLLSFLPFLTSWLRCFGASSTDWNVADLTPGIPHLTVRTPLALLAQVHSPLPLAQPRILDSVGMHVFFLCSKHAFSFLRCWSCCYAARLPCASRVLEDSRLGLHHAHWVLLGRKWTCNLYEPNSKLWRAADHQQVAWTCVWKEDGFGCWSHVLFFSKLWLGGMGQCCYAFKGKRDREWEKLQTRQHC